MAVVTRCDWEKTVQPEVSDQIDDDADMYSTSVSMSEDEEVATEEVVALLFEDDQHIKMQHIEVPNYKDLKAKSKKWESPPLSTKIGYRFTLVVRPNGLKYTKSYNKSIGVWLKPMPSERDDLFEWPARVRMALRVEDFSSDGNSECDKGLVIPMEEYSWKRDTTNSRYPVFGFPATIKHSAVEEAKAVVDGTLYIVIEEDVQHRE